MKDVTFNEIIDEIHDEFPTKVPRFVIKEILKFALRMIFNEIKKEGREFHLHYSDLVKVYEITDGKRVFGLAADVDETKVPRKKDYMPVQRLPYYDITVHNSGIGKKKKVAKYRGYRKRKVV